MPHDYGGDEDRSKERMQLETVFCSLWILFVPLHLPTFFSVSEYPWLLLFTVRSSSDFRQERVFWEIETLTTLGLRCTFFVIISCIDIISLLLLLLSFSLCESMLLFFLSLFLYIITATGVAFFFFFQCKTIDS